MPQNKRRSIFDRLKNRYRLIIINDNTFEENFSLRLTPLGFAILTGAISIFMIFLVIITIAFTPLREYIPGYGSDMVMRQKLIILNQRLDSLGHVLYADSLYIANLGAVISGKDSPADSLAKTRAPNPEYKNLPVKPSREDSLLRADVESQDQYSLLASPANIRRSSISSFFFFSPLKGVVTSSFNAQEDHFGVDVTAKEGEAIKATLDGTVVFSGWTIEDGHVIQLQHEGNLVSAYKHNSVLLKKTGEYVKAGEAIAIIGNSGEHTSGPHLHFELWYNGIPVNPQEYMAF